MLFFLGVFYAPLITTANNIVVEMLIKEVVIPFLFDFWSVVQKVKLFEELKTASFSSCLNIRSRSSTFHRYSLIISRNPLFIKRYT